MVSLMQEPEYTILPSSFTSEALKQENAPAMSHKAPPSLAASSFFITPSIVPNAQLTVPRSPRSRSAYLIEHLAFWRKRRATAAEIQSKLTALSKSHEKYCENLHAAYESIIDWARYISPASHINEDLLQHTFGDNIGEQISFLLNIMGPVVRVEKEAKEAHGGLAHSFQAIKQQEENLRTALRRQEAAEKRYFKAMASDRHLPETVRLNEERERSARNVEDAASHLRKSIRRELPLRFHQYCTYYSSLASASSRAGEGISNALNDPQFPLGEISSYRNSNHANSPANVSNFYSPQSPYALHGEVAPLPLHRLTKANSNASVELPANSLESGLHMNLQRAPTQPGGSDAVSKPIVKNQEGPLRSKSNTINDLEMTDFNNSNFVWT